MKKSALILLVAASLMPPAWASTKIYRWTAANGNVVFSDHKPPPGITASTVKLRPMPTIPSAAPAPSSDLAANAAPSGAAPQTRPVAKIVSPSNEQAVRANNGDITFHLSVSPALTRGQVLHLYLDGKPAYVGHALSVPLVNLDRGAHDAYVVVTDASGHTLSHSRPVKFYVLRHSILFKKPAPVKP